VKPCLVICLTLVGCSSQPAQVIEPSTPAAQLGTLEAKQDKIDGRVAGALAAIEVNADKPPVVRAEAKLAQSYLPPASEGDKAFALARAAAQDEKAYREQMEYGRKFLERLNLDWKKADDLAKLNAVEIKRLADENKQLRSDLVRVEKEGDRRIWTLTGAALVVLGGAAMALVGIKKGAPLLVAGLFAGSIPYITESEWFAWIVGGTGLVMAGLLIWVAFDKARDAVNENETTKKEVQDR
jgi:hypothetical protein